MKRPWFYVLLSLASSDRYGSDIQEDVRHLTDGEVKLWPATLYGSLDELRERGWIRQLEAHEQPDDGGGRERFYRITDAGREALRGEVRRMEELTRLVRTRMQTSGVEP